MGETVKERWEQVYAALVPESARMTLNASMEPDFSDPQKIRLVFIHHLWEGIFREKYLARVTAELRRVFGQAVSIDCVVEVPMEEIRKEDGKQDTGVESSFPAVPKVGPREPKYFRNLRPELRFDTFVVGHSNRLAYEAVLGLGKWQKDYNPLLVVGGVGFGKTHLLHAVAQAAIEEGSQAKGVIPIHAQAFYEHFRRTSFAKDVQEKNLFDRHYKGAGFLLVDDVNFLVGKIKTAQNLRHFVDEVQNNGGLIMFTSLSRPRDLDLVPELRDKLSEFSLVNIKPPENELRTAILVKKAEGEGLSLTPELAKMILERIGGGTRSIVGAAKTIKAHLGILGGVIDAALVKELFGDRPINPSWDVPSIKDVAASCFKITPADLLSRSRVPTIIFAQKVVAYLCKVAQMPPYEIGRVLERDPYWVLRAIDEIEKRLNEKDADLNISITSMTDSLSRK